MLQYERIDVSEGTDLNKTCTSEECVLCHYSHFGFKFEEQVCNRCHDLLTIAHSLRNIVTLSAKLATLRCLLIGISKNEALKKLNNSVTYERGVL